MDKKKSNQIQNVLNARFESIGISLPRKRVTSDELMASLKNPVDFNFEDITGIRARHVCSSDENSVSLAVNAAKDCLSHSQYNASDIDMIVNCSISKTKKDGTIIEPLVSMFVKDQIAAINSKTLDISNACAGMFTGVFIVNSFIKSGIIKRGMVVSGEHITPSVPEAVKQVKSVSDQHFSSLTIGDAGAAVILETDPSTQEGITLSGFNTNAEYSELCIARACKDVPGSYMVTDSKKLLKSAGRLTPGSIATALSSSGLKMGEVDHSIPHQASIKSIQYGRKLTLETFGERAKNTVINLGDYGNTASTTHFLALYKNMENGSIKSGDNIMMISQASGIVISNIVFKMDKMVEHYGSKN